MKKITTASKNQLRVRFAACVYALLYIITLPAMYGILPSYSSYYLLADGWYALATSAVALGMWMHRDIKWSVPSYALVGIALFNYVDYYIIHHILAFIFFVSSTYIMYKDKRYGRFGDVSITWYVLLVLPGGIFWFEAIQAVLIVAFHMSYVRRLWRVRTEKE
jgi:hypothetical protein